MKNNHIAKLIGSLAVAGGLSMTLASPVIADWDDDDNDCRKGDKSSYHTKGHHKGRDYYKGNQNLELNADEVRTLVTSRLIYRGNDRLKVGEIKKGEKNTYQVEIVTLDNSLVEILTISGATGFPVAQR
ncbi:MAG: hypothetical protein CMI12_13125 [Oceanospirillum sp.]|nr:hypothetical protein [Oceanospirillum sp.]